MCSDIHEIDNLVSSFWVFLKDQPKVTSHIDASKSLILSCQRVIVQGSISRIAPKFNKRIIALCAHPITKLNIFLSESLSPFNNHA